MSEWTWPAAIGLGGGVLVFVAMFLPIVAVQSRRYGRLSFRRTLVSAAVAVYGVALIAYTLLPLPYGDLGRWCAANAVAHPELLPGHSIGEILEKTAGLGVAATLTSRVVLQVVFNVVLFIPWGLLVRRVFGWGVVRATASGLLASVLIELTQFTGIWGLIGCSYRVADVDDVITNTAGALIGAVMAPLVLGWIPKPDELQASRDRPRPVTRTRRLLGMGIDAAAFVSVGYGLTVLFRTTLLLGGVAPGRGAQSVTQFVATLIALLVVFVLPGVAGQGASIGQRAMWLAGAWRERGEGIRGGRPPLGLKALRLLVGGGLWGLASTAAVIPATWLSGTPLARLPDAADGFALLLALASVVAVFVTRDRRGLSYAIVRTPLIDARVRRDR